MQTYTKISLLLSSLVLSQFAYATSWSYAGNTGPSHWATLSPEYQACASGLEQSPINIHSTVPGTKLPVTNIHYQQQEPVKTEQPWQVHYVHGTVEVTVPTPSKDNYVEWQAKNYLLIQFHFHTPAENHLDGRQYPMELHFVNQAADGSLAVIAVFFKAGHTNPTLNKILAAVPASKEGSTNLSPKGVAFPIEKLLPSDVDFYAFEGSLTTPPCSEQVQWLVMKTPIEASSKQIAEFKKYIGGNNARPIQDRQDRPIALMIH